MKTSTFFVSAVIALVASPPCTAAVTCTLNKDTKKFERISSSAAKQKGAPKLDPSLCDGEVARQTLEDVQQAINTAGSKLVNQTVIVNNDKLPLPVREESAALTPASAEPAQQPKEARLPGAPANTLPAPTPDKQLREWVLRAESHNTLEEALEEFASRVGYELVYEAREFPLNLKRDITIARDADFWEALRVLGETYRKSDGAFQVLPTEFNQIVIVPMGQNTATTTRP